MVESYIKKKKKEEKKKKKKRGKNRVKEKISCSKEILYWDCLRWRSNINNGWPSTATTLRKQINYYNLRNCYVYNINYHFGQR